MKIFGVELVPLDVPLHRRLQTLAVFLFLSSLIFLSVILPLVFVYGFFTRYYYLSWMYLTWMWFDWKTPEQGGRAKQWVRNFWGWRILASYFPIRLVKTADLKTDKNYIFCYHPHGIVGLGCVINFVGEGTGFSDLFPGIKAHVCTLKGNFNLPGLREAFMFMGFYPVSKESLNWILSRQGVGNAAVIAVGGAAEALDARPGEATLTLKNRKGFVKIALQHGASLVPVFSFGENDLYDQVYNPVGSPLRTFQNRMAKIIGVSWPLAHGRGIFNYNFGPLPHRRKVVTVVGRPMDVARNENPSEEDIDRVHNEYLQELTKLYDQFKGKYGHQDKEIAFI